MNVLAIVDFGLTERTGGYKRNFEMMRRLRNLINLDILPSVRNVRLAIDGNRRELVSLLESLNASPSYVLDLIERVDSVDEYLESLRQNKYDLAVVYSNSSENVRLARRVSKSMIGVQLQLEPFYANPSTLLRIKFRGPTGRAAMKFKEALEESRRSEEEWLSLIRGGHLNFVISVSHVPLVNSGLDRLLDYDVTFPANSIDEDIFKYRREKEDYAVYFTRLMPEKGLFEVPLIWRKVNDRKDLKLYVIGQFIDPQDEEDFLRMSRRLNVNLEYLGFLEGRELYERVASALFTLYPSHYDSFSLVVLESLALNTPVITYDTPAIREIYSGVKGVYSVKEDNIQEMANLCFKDLEVRFPEIYSSWDKVARAELESMLKVVKK
ncbi:glycosyltransferase family 4 protein [Metallosphaera cuprina]|uniref:Glycosyl transferase, group 1 n=1 Tax=Metallosphaera cuprina (strain Ar-4) TaxID=1006006 RepID=F4G2F3_METCR|nr:glycosyltransferase [Metallosphaera cuprina]AEB95001.1 glycosyl transferase, group 1 [Metallosphaera cuprina Ar-4]